MGDYSNFLLQVTGFLVMASILAYMFKIAGNEAENQYRLEHSISHSDEDKARIIGRKKKHLKILLGIGFWLMIGIAGIYTFLFVRAMQ